MTAIALYLDRDGLVPLALLACLLHECGHLLALWLVRGRLQALRLSAVGAEMIVVGVHSIPAQILLALAGPAINILVAVALPTYFDASVFVGLNVVIAVFNLLPLSPLDGGRALFALCCLVWSDDIAERIKNSMDLCLGWGLCVLGVVVLVFGGSFTLLILAMWMLSTRKRMEFHKNTCK